MPYTTDPENPAEQPNEYEEPILAASPEEAERICRNMARRDQSRLKFVRPPSRVRPGRNQRYICVFEGNPIEW
jgi:hypothetical protein